MRKDVQDDDTRRWQVHRSFSGRSMFCKRLKPEKVFSTVEDTSLIHQSKTTGKKKNLRSTEGEKKLQRRGERESSVSCVCSSISSTRLFKSLTLEGEQ